MSDAEAFIERAETDEAFAKELEALSADPYAVIAKIHESGYDATPEEMREAFLERYGAELTPEQLDVVAAGADPDLVGGIVGGLAMGITTLAALAAAVN